MLDTTAGNPQPDTPMADLGPLAWVFEELRKSLDGANKSIRRFVRESEQSRRDDLDALDPAPLRLARQQLHQAVGALEMVGMTAPAQVLRAMEAAVNRFALKPLTCTEDAATTVEKAGFALIEYLEGVLGGKPIQPVALFAQYRDVQQIAGAERVHPADLWPFESREREVPPPEGGPSLQVDAQLRSLMDRLVLLVVKSRSPAAAQQLARICGNLSSQAGVSRAGTFWRVAAAYFEAMALDLLADDVYVKRAASRVLLQYAAFSKGQEQVSETLLHDLLFFCAQAHPGERDTQHLRAVRDAFGLSDAGPVDYERALLGRYDPALLQQARKRINAAKESWSLFAGGDVSRSRQVVDQFGLIADSLIKLLPGSNPLAQALVRAVEQGVRNARGVPPELAMEVATTTLYLEAAFEEFDPSAPELAERIRALTSRIDGLLAGGNAQPLDPWMEQLYRRVSDRQTLGSVVGELKVSLAEAEKSLDQFFRNPVEKAGLHVALTQLSQMRGVLSVLGLDQAVQTVQAMRQTIDQILDTEVDEAMAREAGTFRQLGDNLSALSFLVDMLSYQPALAKKVFVYDEIKGELIPLMGRTPSAPTVREPVQRDARVISEGVQQVVSEAQQGVDLARLSETLGELADQAGLAEQPEVAKVAREAAQAIVAPDPRAGAQALVELSQVVSAPPPPAPAVPAAVTSDEDDDDLLDVFLEEAAEVVAQGRAAIEALRDAPGELEHQTTLRRTFHTLKGSSRMVGLAEFGEAAWAMEQVLNALLAEQRPVAPELLSLSADALGAFAAWRDDIAAGKAPAWRAQAFRASAEAWHNQGELRPIARPDGADAAAGDDVAEVAELPATPAIDASPVPDVVPAVAAQEALPADFTDTVPPHNGAWALDDEAPALPAVAADAGAPLDDIDFSSLADVSGRAQAPSEAGALTGSAPAVEPPPETQAPATVDAGWPFAPGDDLSELEIVEAALPVPDVEELPAAEPVFLAPDAAVLPVPDVEELPAAGPAPEAPAVAAEPEPEPEVPADDETKVVGPLRMGIRLYNVYLNEADEWSRRLCNGLSEWALERHRPLWDQAEALAHSLAGSSATVGFQPLSGIARALEHALAAVALHQKAGYPANEAQARLFVDAAEDIRRLLHQFAAGFYKEPQAALLAALHEVVHAPLPAEPAELAEPEEAVEPAGAVAPAETAETAAAVAADAPDTDTDTGPVTGVAPFEPLSADAGAEAEAQVGAEAEAEAGAAVTSGGAGDGVQDIDDDIDVLDTIDVDLFPIFTEEALELLPRLGGALRQWVARPENGSARAEVLRALHTLKGSARLAGALRLGEMVHRMETDAESLGSEHLTSALLEPLIASYDAIHARFDALREGDASVHDAVLTAPETTPEPAPAAAPAPTPAPVAPARVADEPPAVAAAAPSAPASTTGGLVLPVPPSLAATRAGAAVRVRPELLDRLMSQTGEVMISRSRMEAELLTLRGSLKDLTGNLDRLRQQLRDIELQAESQMQSRLAQAKDANQSFDPLEFDRFTRVQELTRMMAESVNDVATEQRNLQRAVEATEDSLVAQGRQARELQRDLLRTRMVEFEGISERLYRVVRQAAKESGKQVRLDIVGGAIEMDRGVLDRMTAAFEHLLRNSVVHGIETPEARLAAGKPAEGRIEIRLAQELNDVSVVFQDDGAGIDLQRLREKAVEQGLIAADAAVSDSELAQLVFRAGLSTASVVSALAGRGVGMDVVRSDVLALGGRIETSTRRGEGTRFTLVLPLTTAVTQVVMLRAGDMTVGVPASLVELVRRVSADELAAAYASGRLRAGNEDIPFYWAGALLQSSPRSTEALGRTLPVVIFRSAAQRVAVHVDEVLGNQEAVVKNLGPQLSRLPGLAGMSVLASGAVALIYNPVALASVYGDQVTAWVAAQTAAPTAAAGQAGTDEPAVAVSNVPLVLVVDDSITVRRVTQRLLQREGYRVALAADGLQALERLQQERPAVVLSDIEMPRMDGFDLVRNIRSDARLADLPVIMITSRIAEKHREHARELGVDHYLGKPYSEEELLALIAHYASLTTA